MPFPDPHRIAGATALVAAALGCGCEPAPELVPYALQRDGRIEVVRNCDAIGSDAALNRCRQLWCERELRTRLANPVEARVAFNGVADDLGDEIELRGSIAYRTSISIPLPDSFTCRVDGRRVTAVETGNAES